MDWKLTIGWIMLSALGLIALGILMLFVIRVLGVVMIAQDSIGIVTKKWTFRGKSGALPNGRIVALKGEAGVQADTLAPGLHFWLFTWQYKVKLVKFTTIPSGSVGVVKARDGKPITLGRVFARDVDSNAFQNARAFLDNGGERGPQVNVMTPGTYRINTAVFEIEIVPAFETPQDKIGIVMMSDGAELKTGQIAGKVIDGHNGFQNGHAFITYGGAKGLQQQVLAPGTYYLNPSLASVELVDMFRVPIGYVGVAAPIVGEPPAGAEPAGARTDLVDPGVYAINPHTQFVELVPTTNIVLKWSDETSEAHKLDSALAPIAVRSKDGFTFKLDVSQIIHISRENAARVFAEFGSMTNLITQVLDPVIRAHFRDSAQSSDVLDFIGQRTTLQDEANARIREAIGGRGVEVVDTLIGEISPPAELMKALTEQTVAQQEAETYAALMKAEQARQALEGAKAEANTHERVITAQREVEVAKAEAAVRALKVDNVGPDGHARIPIAEARVGHNIRRFPEEPPADLPPISFKSASRMETP